MAAEVARFLTEVAEFLTAAEVVALPMAVEAVPTVIDKISESEEGPAPHQRGGPLFFFGLPRGSKNQPTTLSSSACLMSGSSPGVSKFDKAFGGKSEFSPEDVIVCITAWGRIL